jgi:hypothetical protein
MQAFEQNMRARDAQARLILDATQGYLTAQQHTALKNVYDRQRASELKSLEARRARQATGTAQPAQSGSQTF